MDENHEISSAIQAITAAYDWKASPNERKMAVLHLEGVRNSLCLLVGLRTCVFFMTRLNLLHFQLKTRELRFSCKIALALIGLNQQEAVQLVGFQLFQALKLT